MSRPVVYIPEGSKYTDLNLYLEEIKNQRNAFAEQQEQIIVSPNKIVEVSDLT
jgi:hypothetical protein